MIKDLVIAITIVDLRIFLILMILLKMVAAITTRVLRIMMIIYNINDNAIMKYDRRECNSEMNINKRMCLNECVNDMYSFNCHKNVMVLKEMKTNKEPLFGAGQAYISLHHDTCLPL